MSELIRRQPFVNKAEAVRYATTLMARMNARGFTVEPTAFGAIETDAIALIVDNDAQSTAYGTARILFENGQMAIAVDGNLFARHSLMAIALALGYSDEEALALTINANECETSSGRPIVMAILVHRPSAEVENDYYV